MMAVSSDLEVRVSEAHLKMLVEGSAISNDVIASRGYRSVTNEDELRQLGFAAGQCRPGLLLPVWCTDGANGFHVLRPDNPRVIEQKTKGKLADGTYKNKVLKYEVPKGQDMRLDCPPASQPMLGDPNIELWITEGQKKADALVSVGLCAISLLGVWNWRGRNEWGGLTTLSDWDDVALNDRDVRIVFDSDVMEKTEVRHACTRLTKWLQNRGATVASVFLPKRENGKNGVDDYLADGRTADDLRALVEAPRPEPQAAAPRLELLFEEPDVMRRPLALIDGRAYAATWLTVQVTRKEERIGNKIIKHDPPKVVNERRLFVVRDDGVVFGDEGAGVRPISDLGFEVRLNEPLQKRHRWSARGVKAYKKAPIDAGDLFLDVVSSFDNFIDFDQSFANQMDMCKLLACYVLATWMLDGLQVIGYMWPNGDRGSGKTHLLHVVSQLAHLGQLILAGGSYATLRDLADYGATLCFDDAETLSSRSDGDSDKRSLLLAGNRRGAVVTVKEPGPDKTWVTRYVDAFCPRLFSATQLPDEILASRTIVIPLIRTLDRRRANIDPADPEVWPVDRDALNDRLWAFALKALPKIGQYERNVGSVATLQGRSLQPWRGILAVAAWLDAEAGITGLMNEIDKISVAYQKERAQLETNDLTSVAVHALVECATSATSSTTATNKEMFYSTQFIANACVQVVQDQEVPIDVEDITPDKVGRVLAKMRFKKSRDQFTGPRGWIVKYTEIIRWCERYGVKVPPELEGLSTSGSSGTSGLVAQEKLV